MVIEEVQAGAADSGRTPFRLDTPRVVSVDSLKGSRVSINENCADQAASYAASYTVV